MRSSTSQWTFSSMATPLVSFKSAQEHRGGHRPYPHFPQRTLPSEKQGVSQYPVTSHHNWHQSDLPPINHSVDGRVFPGTSVSQPMYVPGNASNLVTSTIGGASPGSNVSPANGPVVGSTDLRSSPSISSGPCQLTIFYNGSVCVYDHVSPEKAQAIMLLAGNGDSLKPTAAPMPMISTPKVQPPTPKPPSIDRLLATQPPVSRLSVIDIATPNKPPPMVRHTENSTLSPSHTSTQRLQSNDTNIANNEPLFTTSLVTSRLESSITSLSPVTQSVQIVASTSGSEGNSIKPIAASVHQATFMEPARAASSSTAGTVNKSSPSAVPQARKASLARFLEKRQERVISVSPYPVSKNSNEHNTIGFGTFETNFISSKKPLDTVESKT